jgi:hypothetical protein
LTTPSLKLVTQGAVPRSLKEVFTFPRPYSVLVLTRLALDYDLSCFLYFSSSLFFSGAGDWTEGLAHARQGLYLLNYTHNLVLFANRAMFLIPI